MSGKVGVSKPLSASGTFVSPPADAAQPVLTLLGESYFCEGVFGAGRAGGGENPFVLSWKVLCRFQAGAT